MEGSWQQCGLTWRLKKDATREIAKDVNAEKLDGNAAVWDWILAMLAKTISGIDQYFGYLGALPWCIARACTVEGAKEVMRQLTLKPFEKQDSFTRKVIGKIGRDIEQRSLGGEVTPALAEQVAVLKKMSVA